MILVVTYISSDPTPILPPMGSKKNAILAGQGWYLSCIDDVVFMKYFE